MNDNFLQLSEIDKRYCQTSQTTSDTITLDDTKQVVNKWLYLEDDSVIDTVFGTVIANKWECDPVWLFLVAPPASGKTEILRVFKRHDKTNLEGFYSLSKLTEHTLISGLELGNKKKDYSLLPKLDGKIVIIKDFTSVLNMRRESREAVFNDLREVYDGYLEKEYGSTAGTRGHKAKIGILSGVTPIIDKYYSFNQSLGERFLKFRFKQCDREKLRQRATENNEKKKEMRTELSVVVERYLNSLVIPKMEDVSLSYDIRLKIEKAADFLALTRSAVSRDGYTKEIEFLPQAELPCRTVGQLHALAKGVAVARGRNEVTMDDYGIVARVVKDSLPSIRLEVISTLVMHNLEWLSTSKLAEMTNLPASTVKLILEDLNLLQVVERSAKDEEYKQSEGYTWHIKDKVLEGVKEAEL